jgi:hypothetical protein
VRLPPPNEGIAAGYVLIVRRGRTLAPGRAAFLAGQGLSTLLLGRHDSRLVDLEQTARIVAVCASV